MTGCSVEHMQLLLEKHYEQDFNENAAKELRLKVEEAKELKSLQKRQTGVSLTVLLAGEKLPPQLKFDDLLKLKTGGVVDMKRVKNRNRDMTEEETDLTLWKLLFYIN